MRDFEVGLLLENGENLGAWKERILGKAHIKMTLNIAESPLIFRRRQPIS